MAEDQPVSIRLTHLRIGPDHPLGMDPNHIQALLMEWPEGWRPLVVTRSPTCEACFIILNGRHRYIAAQIMGYAELKAVIV